jgi:selenide, water dikinase
METGDDAGIYQVNDELALVQTVDFFTPIVDDPENFGRIAAANALSDVYAMGGKPLTALNIVCFPLGQLNLEILKETLAGGSLALEEAGVVLLGGHSVRDTEFKYGMSVTGQIHPNQILEKKGGQPGDHLILTKSIGTGVLSSAGKQGHTDLAQQQAALECMVTLNKQAAEIIFSQDVRSCTDITGFGFIGHAVQMVQETAVGMVIDVEQVPLLPGAVEHAGAGRIPGGLKKNRSHYREHVDIGQGVNPVKESLLYDPQTSGGLFFAIDPGQSQAVVRRLVDTGHDAAIVGEVQNSSPGRIILR